MKSSMNFNLHDLGSDFDDDEEDYDGESENLSENNKTKKYNENEEEVDYSDDLTSNDSMLSNGNAGKKIGDGSKDNSSDYDDDIDGDNLRIDMEDINESDQDKLIELLFCVQGIGKFTDENRTVYEKEPFCEASLRDIHRFLRKDDPEDPKCRYTMLSWKIAENDIIPLILNYENNEKLQQLGIVILTDLTEPLTELVEKRTKFENMLTELQESIVNSKLIDLLARSLADSTAKLRETVLMRDELKSINRIEDAEGDEEEKNKSNEIKKRIAEIENKSQSTIELIFTLFKQILNITNPNSIKKTVENTLTLIQNFSNLNIFNAIVIHSQNFKTEFYKRLSNVILELVFSLTRPFTITQFFSLYNHAVSNSNSNTNTNNNTNSNSNSNLNKQTSSIQALIEEEKQQKKLRQATLSSRPNNFGTMIKVTRPMDNSSFIVTNVNELFSNPQKLISEKINEFSTQKRKPKGNIKPKGRNISASKLSEEIKLVNDFKISENFSAIFNSSHTDIIFSFKSFCDDYIKHCFNEIIKHFSYEIKLRDRLEKYDVYHIIRLMSFFIEYNRFNEHLNIKSKANKSEHIFNYGVIAQAISSDMMEYVFE